MNSCKNFNVLLEKEQNGKKYYKLTHVGCHELSCPICFSERKSEYKKIFTYCISKYSLFYFNTLTQKDDSFQLWDDFKEINRMHRLMNPEVFKKAYSGDCSLLKAVSKYKIPKSFVDVFLNTYSNFSTAYNSSNKYKAYLFYIFYLDVLNMTRRYLIRGAGQNIQNISLIGEATYFQACALYLNNYGYFRSKCQGIFDNIQNIAKFNIKYNFCRVLEFQKNGNPHFHILSSFWFDGIISLICGSDRVRDSVNFVEDKSLIEVNRIVNYLTKYITKTSASAAAAYRIDYGKKIQDVEFSFDGKFSLATKAKEVLGFEASNDWKVAPSDIIKDFYGNNETLKEVFPLLNNKIYDNISDLKSDVSTMSKIIETKIDNKISLYQSARFFEKGKFFDIAKTIKDPILLQKYNEMFKKWDEECYHTLNRNIIAECIKLLQDRLNNNTVIWPSLPVNCGLDDVQGSFIDSVGSAPVSLLVGAAGCGKTYTVSKLFYKYDLKNKNVYASALSSQACTVLKKAGFKVALNIYRLLHSYINDYQFTAKCPMLNLDLLVIDESSMMSPEQLLALLERVSPECKLVFVGDNKQLEAVSEFDGPSALDIVQSLIKPVVLEKVYRSSNDLVNLYSDIRKGHIESLFPYFQEFNYNNPSFDAFSDMNIVNTHTSRRKLNSYFRNEKNSDFVSDFEFYKVGDEVIFTSNNLNFDFLNGDKAIITAFDDDFVYFNNGKKAGINCGEFILSKNITCHKSQGSEADSVSVFLDFSKKGLHLYTLNYIYTAITRAKKELKVFYILDTDSDGINTYSKMISFLQTLKFTSYDLNKYMKLLNQNYTIPTLLIDDQELGNYDPLPF